MTHPQSLTGKVVKCAHERCHGSEGDLYLKAIFALANMTLQDGSIWWLCMTVIWLMCLSRASADRTSGELT